jgi:hypothetical protein
MPQLDKLSFLSQLFWLSFFFFSLYFFTINFFVNEIFRGSKLKTIINNNSRTLTSTNFIECINCSILFSYLKYINLFFKKTNYIIPGQKLKTNLQIILLFCNNEQFFYKDSNKDDNMYLSNILTISAINNLKNEII